MKIIASLVIALATFISVPTAARAYDCGTVTYYAPVVLVGTCEVGRSYGCRTAYDCYGRPYNYRIVAVTYRSSYSDGSARIFTRVYRA